jgi:hypothetical protein
VIQERFSLPRIISGGQSGADQAALVVAKELGFETGGYAPSNFYTETGPNPDLLKSLGLKDSGLDYVGRTRLNVKESDFTIWFGNAGTAGFYATRRSCNELHRPFYVDALCSDKVLAHFIVGSGCVNIAGNRASHNPQIVDLVTSRMRNILTIVKETRRG